VESAWEDYQGLALVAGRSCASPMQIAVEVEIASEDRVYSSEVSRRRLKVTHVSRSRDCRV
jgi:hypothetical protein